MCTTKEDIELIKEFYKPKEQDPEDDETYYKQFYLELYNKIGMADEYLSRAKESGFTLEVVDKLMALGRLKEALTECEKAKGNENPEIMANKKIEILQKLGRKQELKAVLFDMVKRTGDINYALRLKKEAEPEKWKAYYENLISNSKKRNRYSFISKLYFHEGDFKNAFEYSEEIEDINYLELLAKKLSKEYPLLSCALFRHLCFSWIDSGSGWPYKKSGQMLDAIKKLDKKGIFFTKTKNEIIKKHKKKYSLMNIIEKV